MVIKDIVDEDFVNYKIPSMFIIMPYCTFKCEKEYGMSCCQNGSIAIMEDIEISSDILVERYISNPITKAVVFGGLEPFDSMNDVSEFIYSLRIKYNCNDDIIIYSGYTEEELKSMGVLHALSHYDNVIVKFGRYIPNVNSIKDEVLGVTLSSFNQYARRITTNDKIK